MCYLNLCFVALVILHAFKLNKSNSGICLPPHEICDKRGQMFGEFLKQHATRRRWHRKLTVGDDNTGLILNAPLVTVYPCLCLVIVFEQVCRPLLLSPITTLTNRTPDTWGDALCIAFASQQYNFSVGLAKQIFKGWAITIMIHAPGDKACTFVINIKRRLSCNCNSSHLHLLLVMHDNCVCFFHM